MIYKKSTKIRSAGYGGTIVGGTLITGLLTVTMGPIGFIMGLGLTGAALKDTKDSARSITNKIFTDDDEKNLINSYKSKNNFKTKITLKDSANNPPLSRLLFGNSVSIINEYTTED